MCNKLFLKDDPAALAYEAAQRANAGYEDEARVIKQKPTLAETIYKLVFCSSEPYGQVLADARKGVRQLSGAWRRWRHERFQPNIRASNNKVKQP